MQVDGFRMCKCVAMRTQLKDVFLVFVLREETDGRRSIIYIYRR